MALLISTDYNEAYFTGGVIGGYPLKRWHRNGSEYYLDRAKKLFELYDLKGKKVLDIGCGLGFQVKDLREMGVDAYGIDISEYAVKEADSPHITLADARTYLKNYKDQEFDLVILTEVLCCFTETELSEIAKQVNRIAKNIFVILHRDFSDEAKLLYNPQTIEKITLLMPNSEIIWREEEDKWQE